MNYRKYKQEILNKYKEKQEYKSNIHIGFLLSLILLIISY